MLRFHDTSPVAYQHQSICYKQAVRVGCAVANRQVSEWHQQGDMCREMEWIVYEEGMDDMDVVNIPTSQWEKCGFKSCSRPDLFCVVKENWLDTWLRGNEHEHFLSVCLKLHKSQTIGKCSHTVPKTKSACSLSADLLLIQCNLVTNVDFMKTVAARRECF